MILILVHSCKQKKKVKLCSTFCFRHLRRFFYNDFDIGISSIASRTGMEKKIVKPEHNALHLRHFLIFQQEAWKIWVFPGDWYEITFIWKVTHRKIYSVFILRHVAQYLKKKKKLEDLEISSSLVLGFKLSFKCW